MRAGRVIRRLARAQVDAVVRWPTQAAFGCDPLSNRPQDAAEITGWLATAIRAGLVSDDPGDGGFPKYVWAFKRETWFEGRLVNEVQGTYKGWPLADDHITPGLRAREADLRQLEEAP